MNKLICAALSSALVTLQVSAATVSNIKFNKTEVTRYERLEATFDLSKKYENPYDRKEVVVDALITGGKQEVVFPCFYYLPVDNSVTSGSIRLRPALPDKAVWMMRFAFQEEGEYTIRFRVNDGEETVSDPTTIKVKGATGRGYVRINPRDRQLYQYDDGSPYHPIGINWAWHTTRGKTEQQMIELYLDARFKILRYWFVGFANQDIEWSEKMPANKGYGLGKMAPGPAALMDSIVWLCEEKNIKLMPVFETHGEWGTEINPIWEINPYNVELGGMLDGPEEFFTNEEAMHLTKNKYRYTIARWAYSTAIFAWEFFNEVNAADAWHVAAMHKDVAAWNNEMADFVHSIDPFGHMVTTSTDDDECFMYMVRKCKSMDHLQYHAYQQNISDALDARSKKYLKKTNVSFFVGEFGDKEKGVAGSGYDECDHARKATWLSMFRKAPAMYWWWDRIHGYNWYHVWRPIADYFEGLDLTDLKHVDVKFENAPVTDRVRAVPGMGFGNTTKQEFIVEPNGTIDGLGELSSFLYGTWTNDKAQWLEFEAQFGDSGVAYIDVKSFSVDMEDTTNLRNNIVIFVDDVFAGSRRFTEPGVLEAKLGKGWHTITFQNRGVDWVEVSEYGFKGLGICALNALALGSDNALYGYVRDMRGGQNISEANAPLVSGASMVIEGLDKGKYTALFIDTKTGEISSDKVKVSGRRTLVDVPDFKEDIAFKVLSSDIARVNYFAVDKPDLIEGHSAILSWDASGTRFTLEGKPVDESGTVEVTPSRTTVYTLVAHGSAKSVSREVTISVGPEVLVRLDLSSADSRMPIGESLELTARALNQEGDDYPVELVWKVSEGGRLSSNSGGKVTFKAGVEPGIYHVTVSAGAIESSKNLDIYDPDAIVLKINCGGPSAEGWVAANVYLDIEAAGESYEFGGKHDVSGVSDPAPNQVYQTVIHWNHRYDFSSLPDGKYKVRIHFTDAYTNRTMDYFIEDEQVLDEFDPSTEAGSTFKVIAKEFVVDVTDGNGMQIRAKGDHDTDVFEAAIEIMSLEISKE